MRSVWLVAKHAYRRVAGRRAFLLLTLAVPLGMAALIAVAIWIEESGESRLPLGYVDPSGTLEASRQTDLPNPEERTEILAYPDQPSALKALQDGLIQALYVLPANYPQTLETDLYYLDSPPGGDAWRDFDAFVRLNLAAHYPDLTAERLFSGPEITVLDLSSGRTFSENEMINIILPFVASFLFFITTMSSSGSMLQVVAEEKENRTMEVLLTSMSSNQLLIGKALGMLAAALTQVVIYVLAIGTGLVLAAPHVEALQSVTVPWTYLGVMALFFLPTFGLVCAVMVAVGAAVTELQQGQQVAGLLNLVFMLPIFLVTVLFENPGSRLIAAFTLFPTTSFLTISLRWGLGSVPLWQLGISWVILVGTTLAMLWTAARVFRAGMLRYGQPLNLKGAVKALRAAG